MSLPPPSFLLIMPQHRVLLSFAKARDHVLESLARAVLTKLYGNALFPEPPVPQGALEGAIEAFSVSIPAAANGGPQQTAEKWRKRRELVDLLRLLAGYVQMRHGNNLSNLLSSGFEAASMNRNAVPLEKPAIRDVVNERSEQLKVRVRVVKNARNYELRYALVNEAGQQGEWMFGGFFTDTRRIIATGLKPGAMYAFSVRALGGSKTTSDWSETVRHRSL